MEKTQQIAEMTAPASAQEAIDPEEFLEKHNIADMADMLVEAHGRVVPLRAGVACAPFARLISGMADRLQALQLPDEVKKELVRGSVLDMAASTENPDIKQQYEKKN